MYNVHQDRSTAMTFTRWLPTFLAFILGGELTIATIGSLDDPLTAAAGGLLAGAVIGAGQWLALRSGGVSSRWIGRTAVAMSAGTAIAALLTGSGTDAADLALTGLIAGTTVGVAQSDLLGMRRATWIGVTAASWPLGWIATTSIGVDVERGYAVFGASGAILVTVLTGLALRRIVSAPAVNV
jgi:hypothetical protein